MTTNYTNRLGIKLSNSTAGSFPVKIIYNSANADNISKSDNNLTITSLGINNWSRDELRRNSTWKDYVRVLPSMSMLKIPLGETSSLTPRAVTAPTTAVPKAENAGFT